jgi:hypothetical protein
MGRLVIETGLINGICHRAIFESQSSDAEPQKLANDDRIMPMRPKFHQKK